MRPKLRAFKPTSALPGMPLARLVRLRRPEARQIGHVRQVPDCGRGIKRSLERRSHPTQSRVCHALGARSPAGRQRSIRLRTHPGNGADPWPSPAPPRVRPSPQWRPRRQPSGKSGTLDEAPADRDQGERRRRMGTRNTCSLRRGLGHLQQCSRPALSTLGGGGNRTRVLQYLTRASPGAACCAFLSPGDHASKSPTGSAAVRCPAWPRGRSRRWILLADARHRVGGVPGLTNL
jgi:hypothetical protein